MLFFLLLIFSDAFAAIEVVDSCAADLGATATHRAQIRVHEPEYFRASDLGQGWLRVGDAFMDTRDLSLHARLPAGEVRSFTLEGRAYRQLARSSTGAYTLLYGSPLSPLLLARTGLLQFGLARPLETESQVLGKFARSFEFAFSPDERYLAIDQTHAIDFVSTENARVRHRFTTAPRALLASRWVDSRTHLVVAFAERASFFFFDVQTGRSELLFRRSRTGAQGADPVLYLADRIVIADNRRDQTSTLFWLDEKGDGRSVTFPEPVEGLAAAPDGRTFLAWGPRRVHLFDAREFGPGVALGGTTLLAHVGYAPDGSVIVLDRVGNATKYRLTE